MWRIVRREGLNSYILTYKPNIGVSARAEAGLLFKRIKDHQDLDDVRFWPLADIASCIAHVRFEGQSRHDLVRMSTFAVAIVKRTSLLHCTCPLMTQSDIHHVARPQCGSR